MRLKIWLFSLLLCLCPLIAHAGAWPQAPGATQVIISYEPGEASRAYDASGSKSIPLNTWERNDISLFLDHGVTDRLTLTAKVNFRDYKTDFERFSGLGSVELGGRWTVHQGNDYVLAVGASVEGLGKGRRNDFDAGGKQGTDFDVRVYLGKSFKLAGKDAFVDLQAARHPRQYEADQWRVDATVGIKPSANWMLMAQTFAGQTDKQSWGQAKWVNTQLSVVRSFGSQQDTSVQLAVRQTTAGRNVPAVNAVIVSVWKNF